MILPIKWCVFHRKQTFLLLLFVEYCLLALHDSVNRLDSIQLDIFWDLFRAIMATANLSSREYLIGYSTKIVEKLYLNEDFADIHFVFDSGERFPANKSILGVVSDVFRAMFNGSYIKKTKVKMVDASANAFKAFLQFIYLPWATITIENVAGVMYLGKKYDVTECYDSCSDFLNRNFSHENVLWIYELVEHLGHEQLEEKCRMHVEENTKSAFESDGFLQCDLETVKSILKMDTLYCSEGEVFEALTKWIKAESGHEELTRDIVHGEFRDLLHEIRFASMDLNMFSDFQTSYGALLTRAEYKEIIKMRYSDQFQPNIIFKKNRRCNVWWDENAIIQCDRLKDETLHVYYIRDIEITTFTVNKPVLLGAFTSTYLYGSDDNCLKKDLPSKVTITRASYLNGQNGKIILYKGKVRLSKDHCTRIVLPKPIFIRPGFIYHIEMKQSPPINCSTSTKMKKKVNVDSDIIVRFHNDPVVGDKTQGLVRSLDLNKFN